MKRGRVDFKVLFEHDCRMRTSDPDYMRQLLTQVEDSCHAASCHIS